MQTEQFDIAKAKIDFLGKGADPIRSLLKSSLNLFNAHQTGILYGTNQTRIKCLPITAWDRGIMDVFDGHGVQGMMLRWFGKYIVTAKKMSPIYFYTQDEDGEKQKSKGVIAHVLRNCADYYKNGISVLICPDTRHYNTVTDKNYCEIPFYVYNGRRIMKSPEMIRADFRIVRHFQSRNSVYIYLPDYGILVLNTIDEILLEIENDAFVREKELLERLDVLIEIVNMASLAQLEQLRGKQKARLLWRKEKHLRNISKELILNEKRYRNLYQTAPIAYISMNIDGKILNCNQRTEELLGLKQKQLLGKNIENFLYQKSLKDEIVLKIKNSIRQGRSIREMQIQLQPNHKNDVWVSVSIEPVKDQEGNIIEFRTMMMDISERKKIEKQLFQTEKFEEVGRLTRGIAHDFDNILSPISGYIEMLLMETDKQDKEFKQMKTILECVNHARELGNQMLKFSRHKEQVIRPINLSRTIEDSMVLIRSSLPSTIKIEKLFDIQNVVILADSIRIRQLILNLVASAFQTIGDQNGTISIRLFSPKEHVTPQNLNIDSHGFGTVCLTVEDDGEYIDTQILEQLFDPYVNHGFQKHKLGIGLSVAHGIVESYNGRIIIENKPEAGNRFNIYFPIFDLEENVVDSLSDPGGSEQENTIRKGHECILLVDDDKKIIDMLEYMFEKLEYRVKCFQKPLKAIEYFKNNPHEFDIVFTDQNMPGLTGVDLAGQIAQIRPELPVILCSGIGESLDENILGSHSIHGILKKPITVKEVSDLFVQLLDG